MNLTKTLLIGLTLGVLAQPSNALGMQKPYVIGAAAIGTMVGLYYLVKMLVYDVNAELISACRFGRYNDVKRLLAVPGIDVNAKDDYGATALFYASYSGYPEIVYLLLAMPGIDVNVKNKWGYNAFFLASREYYTSIVKLLLNHKSQKFLAKEVLEMRKKPNNYMSILPQELIEEINKYEFEHSISKPDALEVAKNLNTAVKEIIEEELAKRH